MIQAFQHFRPRASPNAERCFLRSGLQSQDENRYDGQNPELCLVSQRVPTPQADPEVVPSGPFQAAGRKY